MGKISQVFVEGSGIVTPGIKTTLVLWQLFDITFKIFGPCSCNSVLVLSQDVLKHLTGDLKLAALSNSRDIKCRWN